MGIVSRVVGGVVGVGILAGGAAALQDDAVRDDSGVIQEAGDVGAFRIQVGDCVQDPGTGAIESVAAVPCAEPHDLEAYASFALDFDEWPGEDAIGEAAGMGCFDQFAGFVGMTYEESIYDFTWLEPTEESFNEIDDKEVLCMLGLYEGGTMTGSARDASQ
ncbi:MAG: hypothetical protein GY713_07030 [Actinomycetia bacterium]|nr:hypothetical protein [Actinomycetes bacterium]MCP3910690.1 hypothetical protein [Actinomycetes bacterium]